MSDGLNIYPSECDDDLNVVTRRAAPAQGEPTRLQIAERLIAEVYGEFVSHHYVECGVPPTDGSKDTHWMKEAKAFLDQATSHPPVARGLEEMMLAAIPIYKPHDYDFNEGFRKAAIKVAINFARQSHQPGQEQTLEEIASRIYLEKFTRKDDPDVIGAAIVSYGIDVLTDHARQSEEREQLSCGHECPLGDMVDGKPVVICANCEIEKLRPRVAELERELAELRGETSPERK